MSTIVAVNKDGKKALAWNTGTIVESIASPNQAPRPKVQRFGDTAIGTAGFAVYYHLLQAYCEEHPPHGLVSEQSVFTYFLAFWRELKEHFHLVNDRSDRDSPSPFADLDSTFLVVNPSGIYHVREVLSVSLYPQFCAIGTGASHAEGAVSALLSSDLTAGSIAERAVEIACMFDTASTGTVASFQMDH